MSFRSIKTMNCREGQKALRGTDEAKRARDRNIPRTYGRRGGGGGWAGGCARAIVTHHRPMTGGRTYDRRGCLKKEDKYASDLMLRRTPDRALKNWTVRPEAGRMATLVTSPANLKTCTAL